MNTLLRKLVFAITSRNEAAPLPPPPKPIALPPEDEAEPDIADEIGYAEGQSFMIEYRDGQGRTSTRRITVWNIAEGVGGVPLLKGYCHERKARRTFRVDRITACIDYDGEVHDDVAAFLVDNFGMSHEAARRTADRSTVWPKVRPLVRHAATLLAALSLSDGTMRPGELRIAADHCAALAAANGVAIDEEDYRTLLAYIRRLRPGEDAVMEACDTFYERPVREITDLLVAAVAVMDADGSRAPEEVDLVNTLAVELTGMEVV